MKTIQYSENKTNLTKLWDIVTTNKKPLRLTRLGKEDIALIPADELLSILESIHLLRSDANAARIKSALSTSKGDSVTPSTIDALKNELL